MSERRDAESAENRKVALEILYVPLRPPRRCVEIRLRYLRGLRESQETVVRECRKRGVFDHRGYPLKVG